MRWQNSLLLGLVVASLAWVLVGYAPDQPESDRLPNPSGLRTSAAIAATGEPSAAAQSSGWGSVKGRVVFGEAQIPEPTIVVKKGAVLINNPERCAVREIGRAHV